MDEEAIVEPQVGVEGDGSIIQMDIETQPETETEAFHGEGVGPNLHESEVKEEVDLVASEGETNLEPYEGMEFESEEAARTLYVAYARHVGFRIRISRYTRSRRDNSIISRLIVCSKEGFRETRGGDGGFGERKPQRQREVTRVGCKAMLMLKKLAPGKWVVSKFVKEHTHGSVPPRKVEGRVVQKEEEEDEEENLVEMSNHSSDLGDVHEPFEGMEFDSEDKAREFYINYARQMGFRARISKYCRSRKDNSIISRQIVCSKEGFREMRIKKEESKDGRVKRPRVITRIGCKALIIMKKLNTGKWVVSRFEKEHNHALVSTQKVPQLLQLSNCSMDKSLDTYIGEADVRNKCGGGNQGSSRESLTVLYNRLCYEAIKYAQEGAVSEEIYNVAMSALKEAVEKVVEAKRTESIKVCLGKELEMKQQPFNFVLIPSTSLVNDLMLANNSIESTMNLNISNGQGMGSLSPVSVLKQSSANPQSEQGLVGNGGMENPDAVQKSEKLDHGVNEVKTAIGCGSNFTSAGVSDANMVALPTLPVTLYMPVTSSTDPSSNSYKLAAASVGMQSQHSLPQTSSSLVTTKDYNPQLYAGPNPQVHATAIAAGARIIPPHEAASLIKAIEFRVRTSKSGLAPGCKQLPSNEVWTPQPCNGADKGPQTFTIAQTHGQCTEQVEEASAEDMRLNDGSQEVKKMEVTMMEHSAVYDSACKDHLFSDGGS